MIKSIIYSAAFILVGLSVHAQNISDAVRYSYLQGNTTARTAGVAGAFGSMGGDIGVLRINPAGLATFYKSEFTLTPSITSTNTEAFMVADADQVLDRSETKFGLSNIGAVFTSRPSTGSWISSNFAIAYSKLADFNRGIVFRGTSQGSYSESLEEIPTRLFEVPFESEVFQKSQTINQKGSYSEITLAWAGSYRNKFDLGLSLGIPFLTFEETKTYTENDANGSISEFNQYERNDRLEASGAGINFKAGVVYKGIKPLRLGASIHSPDFLTITEEFGYDDTYTFDDNTTDAVNSEGNFKYVFRNPWKFNGSIGLLYNLGKLKGFVNADVERIMYTSGSFDLGAFEGSSADDIAYGRSLNEKIDNELRTATNIRLGTELAYDRVRGRVGVALVQSPFAYEEDDYNPELGFGLGYRADRFFLDVAYTHRNNVEGYLPYQPNGSNSTSPLANFDTTKGVAQVTAGFKF